MLTLLLVFLLVSNALTIRRDKSILFSIIAIKTFLLPSFIAYNNIYIKVLENGIGIYGGLFNVTTITQSFNIFVLLVSATILSITAFFPRKVYVYIKVLESSIAAHAHNFTLQLISQIKGYFYINPFIAISLAITLFSFVGIPPIIGFSSKQMILSAALDNGYVFMSLLAIITSVIGAGYYLNLIKQIFFYDNDYEVNNGINKLNVTGYISSGYNKELKKISFTSNDIILSSSLSISVSVITLLLLSFIYIPEEWFDIVLSYPFIYLY